MSRTAPTHGTPRRALPAHPIGWAALVLLLVVIAVPAWWGGLQNVVGSGVIMTLVALALCLAAFGTGGAAVLSHRDDAIVLRIALAVATVVTLAALMVLAGFAFGAG
ncbi:hypothetical protein [Angustibacter sp. Root456]|uniref:hypothetical protein n=1 Tax=Angustibacter sp. Root456 TaxID=1736539 RepID=UPI0012F711E6|nr:hypothetical protein [Angustibacter sp. Root456]